MKVLILIFAIVLIVYGIIVIRFLKETLKKRHQLRHFREHLKSGDQVMALNEMLGIWTKTKIINRRNGCVFVEYILSDAIKTKAVISVKNCYPVKERKDV